MARRMKREDAPIFMPYTCPGCEKRGSVGFTLGSLPFDFTCSSCGMPSHVRREDEQTVTLTFDTDTFVAPPPAAAAGSDDNAANSDDKGGAGGGAA
jgi:hypothetical protein